MTFYSIHQYSFPRRDQPKASTAHKSTRPRSIPKEKTADGVRSPSASDYSNYTTSRYSRAPTAEFAVAHRNSGKTKKGSGDAPGVCEPYQSSSTARVVTVSVPIRGDPATSDLCDSPGLEWPCLIDSCPKKSVTSGSGREFIRHIYDCHKAQFGCSTPWCVFFAEKNERICPACYDRHPRLKEARVSWKKLDHNRAVTLQGSEPPPPPPSKRTSSGNPSPPDSDRDGSKTAISVPEINKQTLPVADAPASSEITDVYVEAGDDSGDSDCGDPDCDDSSNAPGEDEWKHYLQEFVRDKTTEFYSIMQWARDRRSHGTGSDRASTNTWSSASTDATGGTNQQDSSGRALKRGYKDRDSYPPDEQRDDDPKKPRTKSTASSATNSYRWACPYDKRELSRCGLNRGYNACTLRGFKSIHNVKEHLYRRHLVYQCERCGHESLTRDEHTSHVRDPVPCALKEVQDSEGVTEKKKERLKSKGGLPKSKVGQWNLIYEIVFPGDPVPSPYQGEVRPTRASSLSNLSRESFTMGDQPVQGLAGNPAAETTSTRSRDSDGFRRVEEALEGRLLDRVVSMLESRLPDTILDARDSIIAEEGQFAFLSTHGGSLPSVEEASYIGELVPRPLAPGWHNAQGMNYANYDFPFPACFDVPPPQKLAAQGPSLEQAKDMTLLRPGAAFSDSAYFTGELIPDPLKPSHETPSVKIAGMNDDLMSASQDDVPFHEYCLNSPDRGLFG